MADTGTGQPGPAISSTIHEVQAVMPSDAALQDALARLTLSGFDRADFSLPKTLPRAREATPEQGAEAPYTDVDERQTREIHTGVAGAIGGLAAAAAVGAATGVGIAAVAGAAVGAAALAGVAANRVSHVFDDQYRADREKAAAEGRLVLAVNVRDPARQGEAERVLREAGATEVAAIQRVDNAIVASGWTG